MSESSVEIHVDFIPLDTPTKHVGTKVLNFTLWACVCVWMCVRVHVGVRWTRPGYCSSIVASVRLALVQESNCSSPGLPHTSQQIGFISAVKLSTRRKQKEHLRCLAGPSQEQPGYGDVLTQRTLQLLQNKSHIWWQQLCPLPINW